MKVRKTQHPDVKAWVSTSPISSVSAGAVVLALGLLATVAVAVVQWRSLQRADDAHFARVADHLEGVVAKRLRLPVHGLNGQRSLWPASKSVEREEFHRAIASRDIPNEFPGAVGLGFIKRVRPGELESFLERTRADAAPEYDVQSSHSGSGDRLLVEYMELPQVADLYLGIDYAENEIARAGALKAARTGRPVIAYPVPVVDRVGETQPGILYFNPIYEKNKPVTTAQQRLEATFGWVFMPIVPDGLLQGIGDWVDHEAEATLLLETEAGLIYVGDTHAAYMGEPPTLQANAHRAIHRFEVSESPFVALIRAGDGFRYTSRARVWMIGAFGTSLAVALAAFVFSIARTAVRVHDRAEEITRELRISEQRYALAVAGSQDGLFDWNIDTGEVYYAPRFREMIGLDTDQDLQTIDDWFSRIASSSAMQFEVDLQLHLEGQTDRVDTEIELRCADGKARWMLCRAVASRDGSGRAVRLAGSLAEITELKEAQDELQRIAERDQLTGLPNRSRFTKDLARAIRTAAVDKRRHFAVLFFDFDRFKMINDSLGHDVGDALLISIADRFRELLRDTDIAARFGGDEFVVLLDRVAGVEQAMEISERLLARFSEPHVLDGHTVVSTASIGLVMSDDRYTSADELIRDADAAMYQAKESGKARCCVFDAQMHAAAVRAMELEQSLRHAQERDELRLLYQPIVDLETGEINGFEALLRWEHPTLGMVRPDQFIAVAEETGLIVPMGEWVIREACSQLARWRAVTGRDGHYVNVNVSKRQLAQPDLVEMVTHIVADAGLEPCNIRLEITETAVVDERTDLMPVMRELRERGFQLAMDDFGTGHSSLSCLHTFPIDILKIDQSFVRNLEEHREYSAVVHAIIMLAGHLNMAVVAEGVETPGQMAQLQAMDCAAAQGYLFARPVPADEAGRLLTGGSLTTKAA